MTTVRTLVRIALVSALPFSLAAPASAIVVNNAGFETGDFTGWTTYRPGEQDPYRIGVDIRPFAAHSGAHNADFGDWDNGSGIYQTLATVPGTTYNISFWQALDPGWQYPGDTANAVMFGAATVIHQGNDPNGGAGYGWKKYFAKATATGSSTELKFFFSNYPSWYHLDDVSVAAVPEPGTWGLMIAGFGMIGGTLRRRRLALA